MNDILKTQQSFARKAVAHPEHRFEDLYHLVCRTEWLQQALRHVLANQGARTPGVDGVSKKDLDTPAKQAAFIDELQTALKTRTYKPSPVNRAWIDKPGKTEKRPLGIPTMRDRVVQEVLRMLMEPVWESDFLDCSHGFRPKRRTMDCIYTLYSRVHTVNKYFIAIEGDIRKCFDRINHDILLKLVRRRIGDERIVQLIHAFLKVGVMDKGLFAETEEGTPQGGIISPLLANIYLHELDQWWWRKFGSLTHKEKWARRVDMQGNAILVRYADDFVLLWNGTKAAALALRDELKQFLWEELHLELSEEKTHVTYITDGFDFLGFHIQLQYPRDNKPWLRVTPTETNLKRFKAKIKGLTRRGTTNVTDEMKFKSLNRIIRGWGNYYRHVSFTHDAKELDYWLNERVFIWLQNKHHGKKVGVRRLLDRYKRREVTKRYNRWNFAVDDAQTGQPIFIAKLGDIPLTRYRRAKPAHPYLEAREVLSMEEPETPFLEPPVINLPPKALAWRVKREEVLRRDQRKCVKCGKTLTQLDVHHEQARREGGTDDKRNLASLCKDCHYQTPNYGGNKPNG
jgi:group II intron reverse transcriptase/maturase